MHIGREPDVAGGVADDSGDPVHREASGEELEIAGLEIKFVHAVAAPVEDVLDVLVVLGLRRADVRDVLEHAAFVGLLDEDRDGELIAVEVPRQVVGGFHDAVGVVAERVGPPVDRLRGAEALPDEVHEHVGVADFAEQRLLGEEVGVDEAALTVLERATGMMLRERFVVGQK